MSFVTDAQTLEDLNIPGKYKYNSIFSLFNQVQTRGGERLIEAMFRNPLTDPDEINMRTGVFQYFQHKALSWRFHSGQCNAMEDYLNTGIEHNLMFTIADYVGKKISALLLKDGRYELNKAGLNATVSVLNDFRAIIDQLCEKYFEHPFEEEINKISGIFKIRRLQWLLDPTNIKQTSFLKSAWTDYQLRKVLKKEIRILLDEIYRFDVFITISDIAKAKGFTYGVALPKDANRIYISEMKHPGFPNAVSNSISFTRTKNLIFLTGANMSGKSTLMKAAGICLYLAHMGFPVSATGMEFSVMDGLYTSINVPDNLSLGLSHFYAEVLRVKKVAQEVSTSKNLMVVFDELFKGTNVKDAYDATLAVTEAFAEYQNCFFIFSTHIMEVGEALMAKGDRLQFKYLPTIMRGSIPEYTFKLQDGITSDRQGMMIIENEGILELINKSGEDSDPL